jgi:hypothetical protein
MTEIEHLLTCLAEEAGEIVQACTKALRFGIYDGYPGTGRTNAADIDLECIHLWTVRKMLVERGLFPAPSCQSAGEKKEQKVLAYMEYAKERGTIQAP